MANLLYRSNTILPAASDDSEPVFGTSYIVVAYERGAVASAATTTGTTINVYAGHGFAANDYIMVGTDETQFAKVTTANATDLVVDANVTCAKYDKIVNLGLDTGTTAPAYDGSQTSIYLDPAATETAETSSQVTCDSVGNYGYYHGETQIWELVLDSDSTPILVIPDVVNVGAAATAYTQTYGTADRTHADFTSADLSITVTNSSPYGFTTEAGAQSIQTQFNALRADVADAKQLINAIIDDLQTAGVLK